MERSRTKTPVRKRRRRTGNSTNDFHLLLLLFLPAEKKREEGNGKIIPMGFFSAPSFLLVIFFNLQLASCCAYFCDETQKNEGEEVRGKSFSFFVFLREKRNCHVTHRSFFPPNQQRRICRPFPEAGGDSFAELENETPPPRIQVRQSALRRFRTQADFSA